MSETKIYPVIVVRDMVLFPKQVQHIVIARPFSLKSAREALSTNREVVLIPQRDVKIEIPTVDDLYDVATLAQFLQYSTPSDGSIRGIVLGLHRLKIHRVFTDEDGVFRVEGEVDDPVIVDKDNVKDKVQILSKYVTKFSQFISQTSILERFNEDDPLVAIGEVLSLLSIKIEDRVNLLKINTQDELLDKVLELIITEIRLNEISINIEKRVRENIEKNQKQFYLREKLKEIQKELGERESEVGALEEKIKKARLPKAVKKKALEELGRLKILPAMSPEYGVSRTYLDWLLTLPWNKRSKDNLDIKHAKEILDSDHYGLSEQKDRILEYLSVFKLRGKTKGEVICFVGPPGSGKTSLAKSIARALGRKFVRISLGGLHDESEIRGHRKTYVGAMPGKIIQNIKKAGTKNPVFLLDEIDKVGKDWRGDPYAALMEVLDPEQNNAFQDNYLEVDFDLSEVIFITTANFVYTIPKPLLDRMEVIRLKGYLDFEKLNIAKKHLIPKKSEELGIKEGIVEFTDDAIWEIIRSYTREAGVRELERQIKRVLRRAARRYVENGQKTIVTKDNLKDFLGIPKYRNMLAEKELPVGVAYGLAWTEYGGEILSVESRKMKGKGKLELTGQLGDVMQESAKTALSFIRSNYEKFGLADNFYEQIDLHIHIPEGAIPKDGPSAGIALLASMLSTLTGKKIRGSVAMTGEITLSGKVLPVGGLDEKCLAAKRGGIKEIIVPKENEREIEELKEEVREGMHFHMIETLDEFVQIVFPDSK